MIEPYTPKTLEYIPESLTSWDIETSKNGDVIAVTGANYNEDGSLNVLPHFDNFDIFLPWLFSAARKDKRLKVLYAHNSGGFEGLAVIQWLRYNRPDLCPKILKDSQNKPISVIVKISKRVTIRFEDSMRRLGVTSLEKLARDFKTPHQKRMDLISRSDYKDMENFKNTRPADFWTYAEEDSIILLEILETFHKTIHAIAPLDKLPLTIGSISLLIWRYFLERPIMIPRNKRVKDFIRRGYVGGRVEAFTSDIVDVITYDVNSLFPSVMIDYPVPVSYRGYWSKRWRPSEGGFYHVKFNQTNKNVYPVLRDEKTKKYVYQGEGVFCHTELRRLIKVGGKFTVIEGFIFQDWENVFSKVQTLLYEIKQRSKKSNPALYQVVKLLLNSLYGKFGQREITTEDKKLTDSELIEMVRNGENIRPLENGYYEITRFRPVEHAFVAIAATITANARVRQHEYMSLVSKHALIYTDTDCFHVRAENCQPYQKFVSDRIGMIKEEHRGIGAYIGKKCYAIRLHNGEKDIKHSKGCPPNYQYEDYIKLIRGEIDSIQVPYESATTYSQLGKLPACIFTPKIRTLRITV